MQIDIDTAPVYAAFYAAAGDVVFTYRGHGESRWWTAGSGSSVDRSFTLVFAL